MAYIGNAPAAGIVNSGNILDGSINTEDLADAAVTAAKLAATAITSKLGYTPVNKAGDTMTGDLLAPRLKGTSAVHHGTYGYWKTRDNSGGGEFSLEYATSDALSDANIKFSVFTDGRIFPRAGVQFPAAQVASSDANTLDDYEEGTWSPQMWFGNTQASVGSPSGRYVKVGRLVTLTGQISLSNRNGGTGSCRILGFPFPCDSASTEGVRGGAAIGYFNGFSGYHPYVMLSVGSSEATIRQANTVDFSDTNVGLGSSVWFTYSYLTSA